MQVLLAYLVSTSNLQLFWPMHGHILGIPINCSHFHVTLWRHRHGHKEDSKKGLDKMHSLLFVGCMVYSVQCSCPH